MIVFEEEANPEASSLEISRKQGATAARIEFVRANFLWAERVDKQSYRGIKQSGSCTEFCMTGG